MVQETLEKTKHLVWPEIEKYLKDPVYPTQFTIPANYLKDINSYWKIVREYPNRKGKYLRPTLVLLVASAMGAKIKRIIPKIDVGKKHCTSYTEWNWLSMQEIR